MSLEQSLQSLEKTIAQLILEMRSLTEKNTSPSIVKEVPSSTDMPVSPPPPFPDPKALSPAIVTETPPTPQISSTVPFSSIPELIQYVMDFYTSAPPEKGEKIEGILSSLGYDNINDVRPEHFLPLHSQIEALRAQ